MGKLGDENQLFELNKKWVSDNVPNNNSKGFLTSLCQPSDFKTFIEFNDIVIAEKT
ncbi:MAG: hypothetical protein JWP78_3163 [Mucilaginibacter sp.]|nr:hypothetical protein [Mucilaginibacter sp.]